MIIKNTLRCIHAARWCMQRRYYNWEVIIIPPKLYVSPPVDWEEPWIPSRYFTGWEFQIFIRLKLPMLKFHFEIVEQWEEYETEMGLRPDTRRMECK